MGWLDQLGDRFTSASDICSTIYLYLSLYMYAIPGMSSLTVLYQGSTEKRGCTKWLLHISDRLSTSTSLAVRSQSQSSLGSNVKRSHHSLTPHSISRRTPEEMLTFYRLTAEKGRKGAVASSRTAPIYLKYISSRLLSAIQYQKCISAPYTNCRLPASHCTNAASIADLYSKTHTCNTAAQNAPTNKIRCAAEQLGSHFHQIYPIHLNHPNHNWTMVSPKAPSEFAVCGYSRISRFELDSKICTSDPWRLILMIAL
jgi:hypothetical protein